MTEQQRGKLKIFMGYAAGVGKTYKMLEEAQELKAAGVDIVIGYFEPHGRQDTIAKIEGLEIVPRQKIQYRDSLFEEMDTGAILARHPQVCVVDEFPHTNVPGSERAKRWEDVEVLLADGIDVLTTMNIQHLESLNDQIWQISGIRVRETVPDWVVQQAKEVVMVAPCSIGSREALYMSGERPSALCRISFVNKLWLRYGSLRSGKRRTKSNIVWSMEKPAFPPPTASPSLHAGTTRFSCW
jgi:Osmosensitive K+ channel histidine kinase